MVPLTGPWPIVMRDPTKGVGLGEGLGEGVGVAVADGEIVGVGPVGEGDGVDDAVGVGVAPGQKFTPVVTVRNSAVSRLPFKFSICYFNNQILMGMRYRLAR